MKRSGNGWLIGIVIAACVCASFFGTRLFLEHFAVVGLRYYPKSVTELDLRGEELTPRQYIRLTRELPGVRILWNVNVNGETVPSETEVLTVEHLDDGDVLALSCMPGLTTVHAENCTDYAQLLQLQKKRPDVQVLYRVTLGDLAYDQDAEHVAVPKLDEAQVALLPALTRLQSVDATGCTDFALVDRLTEEAPQWHVECRVVMGRDELSRDLTVAGAEGANAAQLAAGIPGMKNLEKLILINPEATAEELLQLREQFPEVSIHWQSDVAGVTVTDDAEELDFSGIPMADVSQVETAANLCPNLRLVNMSDCGVDNDTMAAFRERHRDDYKVVWTIHFSKNCKLRTDDKAFMPYQQGEYYFKESMVHDLMYCEELETIDLGHHKIKTIEFVRYMPHLQFLILAHTEVQYITPISECKELVYLELDFSTIRDISPLVGCTALEDLNVGHTLNTPKLEPLMQMTWLKHLWVEGRNSMSVAALRDALPDTIVCGAARTPDGLGWRKLPNYFKQRDNLGMFYMN